MTLQEQKYIRIKRRKRTGLLLVLALVVGFVAGVIFTIVASQNYTIVVAKPDKTTISKSADNNDADFDVSDKVKENVSEKRIENKKIIAIDAGHQQKGNFSQEPIGPGATQTKAKVSGGTTGILTKIPEYQVTLEVSLILEEELKARGYDVVMIRRTNDVDISNSQRAMTANEAEADAFVRIHCNGAESSAAKGVLTICQTSDNQYCGDLYSQSRLLSEWVLDHLCKATGAKNLGVMETDTMSGINWCRVPVTIVEMGFMTNPDEDKMLCDPSYQKKLVNGLANGIDAYFNN